MLLKLYHLVKCEKWQYSKPLLQLNNLNRKSFNNERIVKSSVVRDWCSIIHLNILNLKK